MPRKRRRREVALSPPLIVATIALTGLLSVGYGVILRRSDDPVVRRFRALKYVLTGAIGLVVAIIAAFTIL